MSIAELGYEAIHNMNAIRDNLMDQIAKVAAGETVANQPTNTVDFSYDVGTLYNGIDTGDVTAAKIAGFSTDMDPVDITTGAGALVLDDVLQALSTVEQTSAQLVAAENKAQQAVNSLAKS